MSVRRGRWMAVVITATGLVAAACGGGGDSDEGRTSDTTVAETTTTLTEESTTTVAGETTTTAVTAASRATATTARRTATTRAPNVVTRSQAPTAKIGGVAQVTTTASTAPAEPPQPGGSLAALLAAEGNGFDPSLSTGSIGGTDPLKLFAVYDGLVYGDGASGSVVPQTAESMTTSDAVNWKLKIRPNIKFTDNTAYDAAAVKFNWDRCQQPELTCSQAPTLKTWKYEVPAGDPLTLNITLPSPNGQFPRIISIGGGGLSAIASPTWLRAAGSRDNVLNQKPVGAGPFTLKDWIKDNKMTLVRNPNYWNAPRPYLDELVFRPVVDESQRVNSFKAGEAETIYITNPQPVGELAKTYPVSSVPSINSSIMQLNIKKAPFNDVAARKGIFMAMDLDQMNKTVFGGVLETPVGIFPSSLPYSDPSLALPKHNLAEAQKLVDEWRGRNGNATLQFTWSSSNSPINLQVAQLAQQMIQRLSGVKVDIRSQNTVQHTADLRVGAYEAAGTVITGVDPEPQFFQTVQTNGARQPAAGYSNTNVDKAIADSRAAVDPNTRIQHLKTLQQHVLGDMPVWFMYRNPSFWPYKSNIKDLAFFDEGGLLSDRVWIKTRG